MIRITKFGAADPPEATSGRRRGNGRPEVGIVQLLRH